MDLKAEKIEPAVLKAGQKFDLKERKLVASGE
jgi:hypothetical protein